MMMIMDGDDALFSYCFTLLFMTTAGRAFNGNLGPTQQRLSVSPHNLYKHVQTYIIP